MKYLWPLLLAAIQPVFLHAEDSAAPPQKLPELPSVNQSEMPAQQLPDTNTNILPNDNTTLPANTNYRMPTKEEIDKYNKEKNWVVTAMEEKKTQDAEQQRLQQDVRNKEILDKERKEIDKPTAPSDFNSNRPSITPFSDAYKSQYNTTTNSNKVHANQNASFVNSVQNGTFNNPSGFDNKSDANLPFHEGNTTQEQNNPMPLPGTITPNGQSQASARHANTGQLPYKKLSNNPYDIPKGYVTPEDRLAAHLPSNTPELDKKNADVVAANSKAAADALKKADEARQEAATPRPTSTELNSRIPDPTTIRRY
ncbi:MAG: hypothetical protein PHD76_02490 [Methylacidiphilales bacterium]|nr:hypothetical protein [Candidatus Methylacidiphilales bacterium]